MKMLFYSSDSTEVHFVRQELNAAGIPCEVRTKSSWIGEVPQKAELWLRNDDDCHRAMMLCLQHKVGFVRRPKPVTELEPGRNVKTLEA